MIKPLDNQDRLRTAEYLNRVKPIDPGHQAITREFAYEIGEVEADQKKHKQASADFGEDSFESSEEESREQSTAAKRPHPDADQESGNEILDITI